MCAKKHILEENFPLCVWHLINISSFYNLKSLQKKHLRLAEKGGVGNLWANEVSISHL